MVIGSCTPASDASSAGIEKALLAVLRRVLLLLMFKLIEKLEEEWQVFIRHVFYRLVEPFVDFGLRFGHGVLLYGDGLHGREYGATLFDHFYQIAADPARLNFLTPFV